MKCILLALCVLPLFAQAQTDSTATSSDTVKVVSTQTPPEPLDDERTVTVLDETNLFYTAAVNGNYASGNVSRLLLNTTHNLNISYRHLTLPVLASFSYGEQNDQVKESEYNAVFTPTLREKRMRYYANYEYEQSRLRGVTSRNLVGFGAGYVLYSDSVSNQVTISNLVLHESSYYENGAERLIYRNSLRLKVRIGFKSIRLDNMTFYQPSIQDIDNYRVNSKLILAYQITPKLALATTYQYTYDSVLLTSNTVNTNTALTFGIVFTEK